MRNVVSEALFIRFIAKSPLVSIFRGSEAKKKKSS